ncbi:methylamine utilization protein [Shewanella sp. MF05960]|uniref:methylamine utilization protein n=1 Tax=Shewanella sp. MF05960 TaxID=3434874 RepID=UPI003D7AF7E7
MTRLTYCLLCLSYLVCSSLNAASLTVTITDTQGVALGDAVVELTPITATELPPTTPQHYEMRQQDRIFSPFVLAVPQGAQVDFPNLDRTRHHVYSFSEAKQFELKLYVGKTESPILFDQPGLVAIGCNIHDYMQAFIYVAKSPYFASSDEKGLANITDLSAGEYSVTLWHPWQRAETAPTTMMINKEIDAVTLTLDVDRQDKPSSPPGGFGVNLNASSHVGQHAK